jgi:hypothetical protein
MSRIQCFWLEPTKRAQVTLRRYRESARYLRNDDGTFKLEQRGDEKVLIKDPTYDGICPAGKHTGFSICDASVVYGECDDSDRSIHVTDEMKLDPAWPKACAACGRPFQPEDQWQWSEHILYERKDTGERWVLGKAPVGAMWDLTWFKDSSRYKKRPDGILLCVRTPDGDWVVDGPSSNGNGWDRTGTVPRITANPSIICGSYHGWLRDGWLESV